jgi:hypothetical protein
MAGKGGREGKAVQLAAIAESVVADGGECSGKGDGGEVSTVTECAGSESFDGIGDADGVKDGTSFKDPFADGREGSGDVDTG